MRTIKTYQSVNSLHYITNIAIGNTVGVIEFKGGATTPIQKNGIFRTDNTALQQAIEADINFNKEFKLISIVEQECPNSVCKQENTAETSTTKSNSTKDDPTNSDKTQQTEESIVVEGVTNKQKAIEWIRKNLNLIILPNTPAINILAIAKERNIIFKDWQITNTPNQPR